MADNPIFTRGALRSSHYTGSGYSSGAQYSVHQCPDSGVCQWPTPDLGENRPGSDRRVYGEEKPGRGGAYGWLWLWRGRSRSWRYGTQGLPLRPVSSPSSTCPGPRPSGTLPETPAEGRDSGPLGSASTPFLPLEPAKEAAFLPPEPSAFPQMAPVDVRIIQKGDQLAQVAREDTASPTLPSLRGSSKTIPTSRT